MCVRARADYGSENGSTYALPPRYNFWQWRTLSTMLLKLMCVFWVCFINHRIVVSLFAFSMFLGKITTLEPAILNSLCQPPVGWGFTYCFTAVGVTPITKGPCAQILFGWHVFCSPGHYLTISAITLTFGLKVKL